MKTQQRSCDRAAAKAELRLEIAVRASRSISRYGEFAFLIRAAVSRRKSGLRKSSDLRRLFHHLGIGVPMDQSPAGCLAAKYHGYTVVPR
jgi:hypothetical protein